MSGSEDPPEGIPGGGEDEFRSVVFDESFVRAARIQEFSAQERMDGAARAVRIRHVLPRSLARQAVALVLLIVLAFGFAVYMGVHHPYRAEAPGTGQRLRVTLIPLVPAGPVPAVPAAAPFAGAVAGDAGSWDTGAEGLRLPAGVRGIGGFDAAEVTKAYDTAREYLGDSGIDAETVTGGDVRKVRSLLDPAQLGEFDSSLTSPSAGGRPGALGWLVRFDPAARITLVGDVRVRGTLRAAEGTDNRLEVSSDHTFVYALRGPESVGGAVSLFTVRRQMVFRFDHQDLGLNHIELVESDVSAGPLPCSAPVEGYRPILAGRSAPGPVATADPFDRSRPVDAVCAPLGSLVQPSPPAISPPAVGPRTDRTPATTPAPGSPPR